MSRSVRVALLVLIIIIGVALRSYQLTARSIWFDEAFTWRLIQFPFPELITRAMQDVHPPLYYIVLKLWAIVFGSSLLALRSFSITIAALLIAAVYSFMRRLTHTAHIPLWAALLVALSPWQIALSSEARMYTLTALLAWLVVWALFCRQWLGFTVAATALIYTHYYGLLILVAAGLWFIGHQLMVTRGRLGEIVTSRPFWDTSSSFGAVALFYLPWLPVLLRQTKQVNQSFWIPPLTGWTLPDTVYRMLIGLSTEPRHDTWLAVGLTLLPVIAILILTAWLFTRRPLRSPSSLLLTVAAGTFGFSLLVSLFSQSIYQDRYFLPIHSLLLVLIVISLTSLKLRWLSAAALSLLAIFFVLGTQQYYYRLALPRHPGVHGAVAELARQQTPNEPIIIGSSFIFFPVLHYHHEEFSSLSIPQLYSESPTLAHFAGGPILRTADLIGPEIFNSAATSLWVIDTSGFGGSIVSVPPGWTKTNAAIFPEVFPYQGDIFLKHYSRVR